MPELPEVETVMRGLAPALAGRRIVSVEQRRKDLRFPFPMGFAERLAGKRIEGLSRRAKYILAAIEGGDCLLMHLGMTGRFTIGGTADGPHDHVVFRLEGGTHIVYNDPRRFGMMDLFAESAGHKLLNGLGVEPLGNELNAEYLSAAFHKKAAPLKAALLDQRIIAGLGNIYVCEALHRAGLSPRRKAGTVKASPLEALVRHIRDILNEAIAAGGSTLQDFAHTNGQSGYFQNNFAVYGREGEACMKCARPIKRLVQSGRSTFYCTACQK